MCVFRYTYDLPLKSISLLGICFQNYTILPLSEPENPSKPCLSCTKQWCLDRNLDICVDASLGDTNPDTGTGKEGDVEARCFQRDSPRDQLVVTLFILTVFGLLVGAGIKARMEKAGINVDASSAWDAARASRRWWEVSHDNLWLFYLFIYRV
ncbi:hypothetical protein BU17DRAFT_51052 [Hysterangium stoloniferum]|nr:hypothetical protein BU17DRAFT_51052 [Hysterangium stoloniferum]